MNEKLSGLIRREFGRVLRNHKYEKTPTGILFTDSKIYWGGTFGSKVDDGPLVWGPNAVAVEFVNLALNSMFNAAAVPTSWSIAPFTTNVAPTTALTAATFTATQGEYTGYTQTTRVAWTSNGSSTAQSVTNSTAPAVFTVGASAVTVYGAGLIANATAKSATTGTLGAAGLFGVANALNAGSTLTVTYQMSGTAT